MSAITHISFFFEKNSYELLVQYINGKKFPKHSIDENKAIFYDRSLSDIIFFSRSDPYQGIDELSILKSNDKVEVLIEFARVIYVTLAVLIGFLAIFFSIYDYKLGNYIAILFPVAAFIFFWLARYIFIWRIKNDLFQKARAIS